MRAIIIIIALRFLEFSEQKNYLCAQQIEFASPKPYTEAKHLPQTENNLIVHSEMENV